MFAPLAQRVAESPSTAFFGAQQPPDDDATTGWLRDKFTSAAGATAAWGPAYASAPVKAAIVTAAAPASTARPLVRRFTLSLPHVCKPFQRLTRTIESVQCADPDAVPPAFRRAHKRAFSGITTHANSPYTGINGSGTIGSPFSCGSAGR